MKKKTLFIITWAVPGLVIIFAASLFFIHTFGATSFFIQRGAGTLDVSDVKAQASSLQGQQISVRGHVAPGSINRDDRTKVTTFTLTDDRESLNIVYSGTLPNNFKPGAVLEVQGIYRSDGIIEANGFGRPSSFCLICHG